MNASVTNSIGGKREIMIRHYVAAIAIALLMFALNIPNLRGQSVTVDEYAHLPAGYSYLIKGDFHIYPKNPPLIKMIEALELVVTRPQFPLIPFYSVTGSWAPWEFADRFVELNQKSFARIYASGRIMNMILGVLLAIVVFVWATRMYGAGSGLVAMLLTATCPNILAHSGLATVDVGFTLFFTLTLFFIWRFWEDFNAKSLIFAGLAMGAANVSKFSGLLMFPILIAIVVALLARRWIKPEVAHSMFLHKHLLYLFVLIITLSAITWTTIFLIYNGRGMFLPLAGKVGASSTMRAIAGSGLGRIGVPLPEDYVVGLDGQLADAERGEFPNYINGSWRKRGVWYYFLESIGLKTTIPAIILILAGLAIGAYRAIKSFDSISPLSAAGNGQSAWIFVHLPAVLFIFMASFVGNLQLGIRYVLPALPLLYIAASRTIGIHYTDYLDPERMSYKLSKLSLAAITALCAWQLAETAIAAPHYLSYFNEAAGGSKNGHEYLLDSNLDWGQDLPSLKKEMDRLGIKDIGLLYFGHADPRLYGIEYHLPRRDDRFVAVSANFLHGYPYALTYVEKWSGRPPSVLDERFIDSFVYAQSLLARQPAEIVGGSIFLYDFAGSM